MVRAASTCPIALAESLISRIANANATPAIIEPEMFTNCDAKNHAKFRSRSGARACRTARLPSRPGRPPCSQIGPIDRYRFVPEILSGQYERRRSPGESRQRLLRRLQPGRDLRLRVDQPLKQGAGRIVGQAAGADVLESMPPVVRLQTGVVGPDVDADPLGLLLRGAVIGPVQDGGADAGV